MSSFHHLVGQVPNLSYQVMAPPIFIRPIKVGQVGNLSYLDGNWFSLHFSACVSHVIW